MKKCLAVWGNEMDIDKLINFLKENKWIVITGVVTGCAFASIPIIGKLVNPDKISKARLKNAVIKMRAKIVSGETVETKVNKWAKNYGVPEALAMAVVTQESGGDPGATRYEANFYNRYIKNNPTWMSNPYYNQPQRISSSFGLTQVMYTTAYSVAKQIGATIGEPENLKQPDLNLKIGLKYLKDRLNDYKGDSKQMWKAVADYNGGKNAWKNVSASQTHANLVMGYYNEYLKALG